MNEVKKPSVHQLPAVIVVWKPSDTLLRSMTISGWRGVQRTRAMAIKASKVGRDRYLKALSHAVFVPGEGLWAIPVGHAKPHEVKWVLGAKLGLSREDEQSMTPFDEEPSIEKVLEWCSAADAAGAGKSKRVYEKLQSMWSDLVEE